MDNPWGDIGAAMPEAYGSGDLMDPFARAAASMATLPQRAFGASEAMRRGEGYDPGPILEAAMLPMGTGALAGVPMRAGEAAFGAGPIRAYHGSPYDFDRFDISKIGSGEGAQSYGHGLYFAENPQVATDYRNRLTAGQYRVGNEPYSPSNPVHLAAEALDQARREGAGRSLAAQRLQAYADEMNERAPAGMASLRRIQALEDARRLVSSGKRIPGLIENPGKLYTVDLHADPREMLDWDKPLEGQGIWERLHPNVQDAVDEFAEHRMDNAVSDALEAYTGKDLHQMLSHSNVEESLPAELPGSSWLTGETTPKRHTAAYLRSLDVPGIKYLDQGSRTALDVKDLHAKLADAQGKIKDLQAMSDSRSVRDARDALRQRVSDLQSQIKDAGAPTSNYVMFDDKPIKIIGKRAQGGAVNKPAFDPNKPFTTTAPTADAKPAFDPNAPFTTAPPQAAPLPDVGAPAIGPGPQVSPGVPALNNLADEASQSISTAMGNVPQSGANFVGNIAEAAAHPIDSAMNSGKLLAGAAQYAGLPGEQFKPYAAAAAKAITDRYGSLDAAKKTFENDPVGFAADVMSVMEGGAGLGRAAGMLPRTAAHVAAPTTAELYEASQNNYRNMKGYGVELHPHVMDQVATNIETELLNEGYRNYIPGHGALFNAVNELRNPVGPYSTISDIDGPRRVLNKLAGDPALRDGARRAIGEIDTALGSLTPADAAVNPQFVGHVAAEARTARGNYAAYKHADQVENATNMAELQAASTGSGGNIDNATRQKFRAILASPRQRRGFSAAELQQMRDLVQGSPGGNAARLVGKLAPTGVVSGALSTALGHAVGHTIGVPVVGAAAKAAGDAITRSNAARVSERVRLRSPEARRLGSTPAPRAIPRIAGNAERMGRRLNLFGRIDDTTNPYAP